MKKSRIIGIISGKGGVGKTTTAINLGASINYFGKSVTVVDANLTTPNVGIYLGLVNPPISLHDVLRGKKSVDKAIHHHESGTRFLVASLALKDLNVIDHSKLKKVIKEIDSTCDYILVDVAAGLGKEAIAAIDAVDEVLIVTNPEIAAVTDALKTIRLSKSKKKKIIGVLITKSNSKNPEISLKDIEKMLEVDVIGIIPEDRSVKISHTQKDAVVHTHPRSVASVHYKELASRFVGVEYKEQTEKEPMSIWDWFTKWVGLK